MHQFSFTCNYCLTRGKTMSVSICSVLPVIHNLSVTWLRIRCTVLCSTGWCRGKTNGLNMYTRAVALVGRMGIQFRPGNSEFF